MRISFMPEAWDDLLHWQRTNKQAFKRITRLIQEIQRHPFDGAGKPEPLRGNLSGYWSRRITKEHRLVYAVTDDAVTVVQCRGHY